MHFDVDFDVFRDLSDAAKSTWAKSDPMPPAEVTAWLPVYQHLADTAATAGILWDTWIPMSVRCSIAHAVGSEDAARALVMWLAGMHDTGKISPAFAIQAKALITPMRDAGFTFASSLETSPARSSARHEIVSYLVVAQWLQERHGYSPARAQQLASVLAAHHGRPPGPNVIDLVACSPDLLGDGLWADTRVEVIEAVTASLGTDVDAWRDANLDQPTLVLLSAVVILADWIASSSLFPLRALGSWPDETADARATRALAELDLPARWQAAPPDDDVALFQARFGGKQPRPIQTSMMRLAREMTAPSLMILEADTGVGKTEAALAAAEILAARFHLNGVFVGLPTQATTDAMYARLLTWANQLGLSTPANIFLAHGKSSQNDQYAQMQQRARFRSIGERRDADDDELVRAHQWFNSPKRGPLSSFVVGTIDQALQGGLSARHVALRHLALAGKVVVLDEVHAYDAFMAEYLKRILHWLGAHGVPVIMLSATLPSDLRLAFVDAYESGRPSRGPAKHLSYEERRALRDAAPVEDPHAPLTGDIGYPSIVTATPGAGVRVERPLDTGRERTIALERIDDDLVALEALLTTALVDGGCAVVIRNTVRRAQETASHLRQRFGTNVSVAHARFLARDRAQKDRDLVRRFGLPARDNTERPRLHIVVATQVVEQSLDIDFDILVTDIAPVDLILQRAGRLHRHAGRPRPEPLAQPRMILTGADWTASPPALDRGTQAVYDRYILLRTAAALADRSELSLPLDTPQLVQWVYGADPAPRWSAEIEHAHVASVERTTRSADRAGAFLLGAVARSDQANLIGWIGADAGNPEGSTPAHGSVRETDDTLEVLVLQAAPDGSLRIPDWIDHPLAGAQVPTEEIPSGALIRAILACSLRLPAALCRGALMDKHIDTLEGRYPAQAWHGSHALRGELVLVVDSHRRAPLPPFLLEYSRDEGLTFSDSVPLPDEKVLL